MYLKIWSGSEGHFAKKSRPTYRDSRDIGKKRVQMTSRVHLNKDNIQKLIVSYGKPAFLVLDFAFKGYVCLHLTSTHKDSLHTKYCY